MILACSVPNSEERDVNRDLQEPAIRTPRIRDLRRYNHTHMKLDVLPSDGKQPWYAEGLSFTCTQCGNCCTGGPGYVWISDEELLRLAEHLKLSVEQVIKQYCRRVGGRVSLTEHLTPQGNYDCVFLREQQVPGEAEPRRTCAVYAARPLQCRTWPFWEANLSSEQSWRHTGRRCPGIGKGRRFTLEQIDAIRTAADWPVNPPSSDQAGNG